MFTNSEAAKPVIVDVKLENINKKMANAEIKSSLFSNLVYSFVNINTDNIKNIEDLEEIYGLKINTLKSTKDKFNKNEHIIKEIIKNHIVLKGIEGFVGLIW